MRLFIGVLQESVVFEVRLKKNSFSFEVTIKFDIWYGVFLLFS